MSVDNPKVAVIRQSIKQSYTNLNELLNGPVGALYATKLYQKPTENEWTIMENLAHIVEFMPYWGNEVAKLVARPGQNFGRTAQDEGRERSLREHGHDTLRQAQEALPGSYEQLDTILSRVNDQDLELTGHHVKFGERTLEWFIDGFIVEHLREHVVQIKECLEAIN